MNPKELAQLVITSLRKGIPPQRGFQLYSVGHEKLITGVKKHHMSQIAQHGLILFINGSYGSGKTHLFRLLREIALGHDCLVSNVELKAKENPFSKFEKVFSSIVRNIQTPAMDRNGISREAEPFSRVLDEALAMQVVGSRENLTEITSDQYNTAHQALMQERRVDLDFRKIVGKYWETYVPNRSVSHPTIREGIRGEALQWFSGEGTPQTFRTKFEVNKIVTGETARAMLQSLAGFISFAGYNGLMILFDEATQAYEHVQEKERKEAYNNLFHLINEIEQLSGLFLVYATTPNFYSDKKYGILLHQALASRVGKLPDKSPRPMDTVWNLDQAKIGLDDYKNAAAKIRDLYKDAHQDEEDDLDAALPSQQDVAAFVEELFKQHGQTSNVRFWRVMTIALIRYCEDCVEGEASSPEDAYRDVMEVLSEED